MYSIEQDGSAHYLCVTTFFSSLTSISAASSSFLANKLLMKRGSFLIPFRTSLLFVGMS